MKYKLEDECNLPIAEMRLKQCTHPYTLSLHTLE